MSGRGAVTSTAIKKASAELRRYGRGPTRQQIVEAVRLERLAANCGVEFDAASVLSRLQLADDRRLPPLTVEAAERAAAKADSEHWPTGPGVARDIAEVNARAAAR
jgi:hypothetical protein